MQGFLFLVKQSIGKEFNNQILQLFTNTLSIQIQNNKKS